jgi:hydroxyethylthiazole kinase-like sugar kinase family protein
MLSLGVSPVSSTNKTDLHDVVEILLNVALNPGFIIPISYQNIQLLISSAALKHGL